MPAAPFLQNKAIPDSPWKDLFYQFSENNSIDISLIGSGNDHRSLKIYLKPPDTNQVLLLDPKSATESAAPPPLIFEEKDGNGTLYTQTVTLQGGGGFQITGHNPPGPPIAAYGAAPTQGGQQVNALMFSELNRQNGLKSVTEALQRVFPQVDNLSLEYVAINLPPEIYCSVPNIPIKIPIGLVSNGISKLLSMLLQTCYVPNGVCLIDEIENGFYYKALPKMWEVVTYLCEQCNVQLFASTHSEECLKYLEPILAKKPDEFRLLRIKTLENNEHTVKVFGGKDIAAALETGTEIR